MKIFDSVRGRRLVLTPEEGVRQWFIAYLTDNLMIEPHRIGREVVINSGNRADIVVYDRGGKPMMIVECKAQEVAINKDVMEQLARYNNLLGGVEYLVATNGKMTIALKREENNYIQISELPEEL